MIKEFPQTINKIVLENLNQCNRKQKRNQKKYNMMIINQNNLLLVFPNFNKVHHNHLHKSKSDKS